MKKNATKISLNETNIALIVGFIIWLILIILNLIIFHDNRLNRLCVAGILVGFIGTGIYQIQLSAARKQKKTAQTVLREP